MKLETPFEKYRTFFLIQDMRHVMDATLQTVLKVDDKEWGKAIGEAGTNRPCDLLQYFITAADKWLEDFKEVKP